MPNMQRCQIAKRVHNNKRKTLVQVKAINFLPTWALCPPFWNACLALTTNAVIRADGRMTKINVSKIKDSNKEPMMVPPQTARRERRKAQIAKNNPIK